MIAVVTDPGPRFSCEAMCGGLARWLRAAGYDASWHDGTTDPELVRLARDEGRMVLSSDGNIFVFTRICDGVVPARFVSRGLTVQAQLAQMLRGLGLPLREPRCMACGGELLELTREEAAGQLPPRSLAFHGRFWECTRCQQVFWHGTHWERIVRRIREAASSRAGRACRKAVSPPWECSRGNTP